MILALDLSMHTGWAAGAPGSAPSCGVMELPNPDNLPRQAAAFADGFAALCKVVQPSRVIAEIDINLHKQNPVAVAEQQVGMAYLLGLLCYRREIPLMRAKASDARSAVMAQTRWAKKGEVKSAVVEWCRFMGWEPRDHNAADACVLWKFACGMPPGAWR